MPRRKTVQKYDNRAIRNWTLYVIELEGRLLGSTYYVGITSKKDEMRRIRQHGGRTGAKVNWGRTVKSVVELQDLGKMSGAEAGRIENDMMLQYRRKLWPLGMFRVRGGYDISRNTPYIPTYTPGSIQSIIFLIACIAVAVLLFFIIAKRG